MTSNHDALLSRLEKAVQQIEAYASKVGSNLSTAVHNATHSGASEQSQAVTDWNALLATHLTAFVDAANKFPDTKKYVSSSSSSELRTPHLSPRPYPSPIQLISHRPLPLVSP